MQDISDINMNGSTTDHVLKTTSKVIGNVPGSLQSEKLIRSIEPITSGGDLNYSRAFTNSIQTNYAGEDGKLGRFQYDFQVKNYYNSDLNKVTIYDVLTHEGDSGRTDVSETSSFSNTLVGPISLQINGVDVTSNFDVYYRSDKYPTMDANAEMDSSEWTITPANYSTVTAVKIVSKDGFVIKPYQILHSTLDMKAPVYDGVGFNENKAYNTFQVKYNNNATLGETNQVVNSMYDKTSISVTKTWIGKAADSATIKLLSDGTEV